jgi:hypothetical protein
VRAAAERSLPPGVPHAPLQDRFPTITPADRLGEHLAELFGIAEVLRERRSSIQDLEEVPPVRRPLAQF